ncbi:RluA family pseudouridine synthase [Moraxella catarrhalis]|uniref:RluA family pseudouridine synthase n=1 Tax=Moraxella catarrhalis TaxID=480 RepID=UPI0013D8D92A|nr:RluA family pseudouridine synthase [Moraxella catarrhalis]
MINYTKTFAKRLLKNVKTMKNLQKTSKKQPLPTDLSKKSKTAKQSVQQSADVAITDFSRVNFLTVTNNQDGQRVDNFLLARLKGLPRSHLYKLIRSDEIRINGKRCKAHDKLYVGDVVRVAPIRLSVREAPIISEELAKGLLERIIFEDDGLIVLNKPHGMAVHGGSGESFGVIEAMRLAMGKKYLELIHRIDKDTSGLLLIAKKRSTLKIFQEQFRTKTIHKQYLCLVMGHVQADEMIIDMPLLRYTLANGERRVKVAHLNEQKAGEHAKASLTKIKTLLRFKKDGYPVSLVLAMPATGRTHQIRVHMAHIGHALLGDDKYQNNPLAPKVGRLCLHAWQLGMTNTEAYAATRPQNFVAPVADDMAQLLPKTAEWLPKAVSN